MPKDRGPKGTAKAKAQETVNAELVTTCWAINYLIFVGSTWSSKLKKVTLFEAMVLWFTPWDGRSGFIYFYYIIKQFTNSDRLTA